MLKLRCYESAVRVVFGSIKLSRPPPASRTATMNVGAGQYKSSSCAITMFPIMPPSRALIIDMATPVALQQQQQKTEEKSKQIILINKLLIVQGKNISINIGTCNLVFSWCLAFLMAYFTHCLHYKTSTNSSRVGSRHCRFSFFFNIIIPLDLFMSVDKYFNAIFIQFLNNRNHLTKRHSGKQRLVNAFLSREKKWTCNLIDISLSRDKAKGRSF